MKKLLWNNLSLTAKFAVVFTIVFTLFLLLLIKFSKSEKQVIERYSTLIDNEILVVETVMELEVFMLECERSEKDFLLYKDLKNRDNVNKYYSKLIKRVEKILSKEGKVDPKIIKFAQKIKTNSEKYYNSFKELVKAWERKGLTHSEGLQGDFRNKVHEWASLVNTLTVDDLYIELLQIRRYEKDFQRTLDNKAKNDSYYKKLSKAIETFKKDLAVRKDSEMKQQLSRAIAAYTKAFEGYYKDNSEENYQKIRNSAKALEGPIKAHYVDGAKALVLEIRKHE